MTEILGIILATAVVNNIVLVQLTGVSALFAYSGRLQQALELAVFSFLVLCLTVLFASLLDRFVLTPLGLTALRLFLFVATSAALATGLALFLRKQLPLSWRRQELALLMVGANSAIIGLALRQAERSLGILESLLEALGAGLGFALLLLAFAALRERLRNPAIPLIFRGPAIQLITTGILAMSLLALGGLD